MKLREALQKANEELRYKNKTVIYWSYKKELRKALREE